MRSLLRAMTRDPEDATRNQRLVIGALLIAAVLLMGLVPN